MEGEGGLIAIDRSGSLVLDFNSDGMYRGAMDAAGEPRIAIFK
jgi:beta-aspartyl-peptidase (threonine type)